MKRDIKIAVMGGDLRQIALATALANDGFTVRAYGLEEQENTNGVVYCSSVQSATQDADFAVLPLPYSTDGIRLYCPMKNCDVKIDYLLSMLSNCKFITGGMFDDRFKNEAEKRNIKVYDYYDREDLIIANAIPTAEGALAIAMNELPITLHSSNVLVLGHGRVGKVLAGKLYALGANVSVAARKESDFAWIRLMGYKVRSIYDLLNYIGEYDAVFNTVPERIIDEKVLDNVNKNTLIVDLASKPGGVDFNSAKEKKIKVVWALSLPGKVAPVSAGRIIKDTVISIAETHSHKYKDIFSGDGGGELL